MAIARCVAGPSTSPATSSSQAQHGRALADGCEYGLISRSPYIHLGYPYHLM